MSFRPRDLAIQISAAQHLETFKLPLDAARRKAREVIDQPPRMGLLRSFRIGNNSQTVKLNL